MDLEARVADLIAQGDNNGAATAALEALGPEVLGYMASLLPDAAARDAFASFAEHLWRGLPAWRGEGSLRAWAYRIAWREVAAVGRDGWRRRRVTLATTLASRLAATHLPGGAGDPSTRRELLAALRERLTLEERTLLVLRIDRGLDWAEVARVLSSEGGEPVNAVAARKRFERLKARLADWLRGPRGPGGPAA